jgi:hypothetical protein
MSPELLNPDPRDGNPGRTIHSDRYAFGMVIYEVRAESPTSRYYRYAHTPCSPAPKVLTGDIPFHTLPDTAVVTRVVQGARPGIPDDVKNATHSSGSDLWMIVQQSWDEDPVERPPTSEVRRRLSVAAENWDVDLARSASSDGYVSVPRNTLLSSGEFSDPGEQIGLFCIYPRLCSHSASREG